MDRLHDIARLLVSSLALAKSESVERQVPTSHGILDRAIRDCHDQFPLWAREQLHFADSRVGWQCIELPAILGWAQTAELTSAPNPSYRLADIRVSPYVARVLLRRIGVAEAEAAELGRKLAERLTSLLKDDVALAG
jgi:hypothetical protein